MREAGFVGGMRLLVAVYRKLGRLPFLLMLYPVMGYFFLRRGEARRASLDYLRRLHADDPALAWDASGARAPGWSLSWRHFLSFANALLDKVLAASGGIAVEEIELRGQALVLPLLAARRGGVMLTAHLGNLEVCQASAEIVPGLRLNVLVHTRHAEKFNRLLQRQGESAVRLIEIDQITPGLAIELSERVAAGEFIVIAADRLTPGSGRRVVDVDFLGSPAPFAQGPFILASLLRCPVFLVFCYRQGLRYRITFEHFAERIARVRGSTDAGLTATIQRYAERLQEHCRQAPLQWFNFYRFWR